jgi:hypothetical protein
VVTRVKLTAVLSLLVAAVQFAGVGAVSSSGGGRAAAEYYCCCTGECHCTADCCHHAPTGVDDDESAGPRIGAATPILEAPRSCGGWMGTLQRSPDAPKALAANPYGRTPARPENSRRTLSGSELVVASQGTLRQSSPRGPPESVDVA